MNCGRADDVIDFIVDNCHCLLTPDDVNVACNIFKFDFAFQVKIIIEFFMDVTLIGINM